MKTVFSFSLALLLVTAMPAQRRGGGFGSGRVGGGFGAGRIGGGHAGMGWGGRTGMVRGGGFGGHAGFSSHWGGYGGAYASRGWYSGGRWGHPYGAGVGYWPSYGWGFSLGYWPGFYDWGWSSWDYPAWNYSGYPVYSPGVTVVYAPPPEPAPATTVYIERARPVLHEYDEWGQERTRASTAKPLYLIAFRDGVIRAAVSYDVAGDTLRYVTEQNEQRSAPLSTVDREKSERLNRERRVPFHLP